MEIPGQVSGLNPNGIAAISRQLSVATLPETRDLWAIDPEGIAVASAVILSGS